MAKKRGRKSYTYHLIRGAIAFVGAAMISWAVWRLLDHYLFPGVPFLSSLLAILAGGAILLLDHFHLKELE